MFDGLLAFKSFDANVNNLKTSMYIDDVDLGSSDSVFDLNLFGVF